MCWMTQRDTLSLVEENIYKVWKVILDRWFTTATESPLTIWYCTSLTRYFILFNMWLKLVDCSISSHSFHLQSEAVIPDVIMRVNLTGWLQTCQTFQLEMTVKISGYSLTAEYEASSKSKRPLNGAKVTASALCRGVTGGTLKPPHSDVFRHLCGCFPWVVGERQADIKLSVRYLGGNCTSEKRSYKTGQVFGP